MKHTLGGKKPGKRGRGAAGKTLVLIAVEDKGKSFGRIRLHRITDASENSLIPAVQESIEPGSTVRTDGWKGYENLSSKGYQHYIVRQSALDDFDHKNTWSEGRKKTRDYNDNKISNWFK